MGSAHRGGGSTRLNGKEADHATDTRLSLSPNAREQELAADRLKSALLSRFILARLSEHKAMEVTNLVAGISWLVIAGHRVVQEVRS